MLCIFVRYKLNWLIVRVKILQCNNNYTLPTVHYTYGLVQLRLILRFEPGTLSVPGSNLWGFNGLLPTFKRFWKLEPSRSILSLTHRARILRGIRGIWFISNAPIFMSRPPETPDKVYVARGSFLIVIALLLLPRDAMRKRGVCRWPVSVCLSVCLSVTLVYCTEVP